jgi:excinuclease ABC subunit A
MREARAHAVRGDHARHRAELPRHDSEGFQARLTTFMVSGPLPGMRRHAAQPPERRGADGGGGAAQGFLSGFMAMDIAAAHAIAGGLVAAPRRRRGPARGGGQWIEQRLHFLLDTGLGYLTLDRDYATLSGGEAQRVRLATQLGMGLIGVIYVLDEPSIGLHPKDNERLLAQLRGLRDRGNTVLVVEHDEETMRAADEIIELGPEAGVEGGHLLFQGTPAACAAQPAGCRRPGPTWRARCRSPKDAATKAPDGAWLTVREAREHNLRGIDVRFPVGLLTCVTGVSGSGKSTLVNDILAAAAARKLNGAKTIPGKHRHIENLDFFEKLVQVDQEPIGRSPRSNPATFVGLLDLLRDLFAQVPLAKVRGYKASRFSFNVRGGRCERCQGDGVIKLDMQFMADAYAPCPSCGGRRFNRETLEILFHGKSIADVLAMTVREAIVLFRNIPRVLDKLQTLDAVGLGLPGPRPVGHHAFRGRGPAPQAFARTEQEAAGRNPLHPGRADHRPALGGYPAADGPAFQAARRGQHDHRDRAQPERHRSGRLDHRPGARRRLARAASWSLPARDGDRGLRGVGDRRGPAGLAPARAATS